MVVPYEVVWSRVAVRASPSTDAQIVGVCLKGERLQTSARAGNWVRLAPASVPRGAAGGAAWMMVDGAGVGCGPLLEPRAAAAPPALVFAATRALVVRWESKWPSRLELRHAAGAVGAGDGPGPEPEPALLASVAAGARNRVRRSYFPSPLCIVFVAFHTSRSGRHGDDENDPWPGAHEHRLSGLAPAGLDEGLL